VQYRFPPELSECTGFDWDKGNMSKSRLKHGITCEQAEQVFSNRPIVLRFASDDEAEVHGEYRDAALGWDDAGRKLFVAFTVREPLIRVISAREMTKTEEMRYAKAFVKDQ
jgi:uncharacterized protein